MAEPKILLINDDAMLSADLQEKLVRGTGFSLSIESTPSRAIASFRENHFDLVIIRLAMSYLDSSNVLAELRKIDPDVIVIAYLDKEDSDSFKQVSRLGIYDSFSHSINEEKLLFLLRKASALREATVANHKQIQGLKEQNISLQKQNILLAERIEEATKNLTRLYEDLRTTYIRTIKTLAQAIDARDHYTHSHSEKVARIAVAVAEEMHLFAKDVELIQDACELHDLGKIGIQDGILTKSGELNPAEWEVMKRHPVTGAQILEPLTFLHGVVDLVLQHHEHYDGSGYPKGLKKDEILLGARIIHLADAYEAMTSARAYRKTPLSKEEAIAEIKMNSGKQFDPNVVEAFLRVIERLAL
jgi:putative nucleotidyltransferase with HDIG domain